MIFGSVQMDLTCISHYGDVVQWIFPRVIINCDSMLREMSIVFCMMCQTDRGASGDIVLATAMERAFVVIMSFAGHLIDYASHVRCGSVEESCSTRHYWKMWIWLCVLQDGLVKCAPKYGVQKLSFTVSISECSQFVISWIRSRIHMWK